MQLRPFVVCAVTLGALPLAPRPALAAKVCAYAIPAEMVDKVDSKTARAGALFRFRITQTTQVERGLTIPKGAMGYGVIRYADAAGRHNHDGSLALEPRYIDVPRKGDGRSRIEVTMNPTLPPMWSPSVPFIQQAASHVPLPVPGMAITALNTVRYGRNITLGPGFTFSVIPTGDLRHGPIC